MKTVKAIKITSILQVLYCLVCAFHIACLAINYYFDLRVFFRIADFILPLWALNPIGFLVFPICLILFLVERRSPEARQAIGKKWIWIFVWPVILLVVYLTTGILSVALTGGV